MTYICSRETQGFEENLKLIINKIKDIYQAKLEYTNFDTKLKLVFVGTPEITDWKAVNNVIAFAKIQMDSKVTNPDELTKDIWQNFFNSKQPSLFG